MSMDASEVLDLAAQAVAAVEELGADQAEALVRCGPVTRITLQRARFSESRGWQRDLALRVWCDGRFALQTTSDCTAEGLRALAQRTVGEAQIHGMAQQPALHSDVAPRIFPPLATPPVGIAEKCALLEHAWQTISQSVPAETILNACYSDAMIWQGLVNSRGFQAAHQSSTYRMWLWVEAGTDHDMLATASQHFPGLALELFERLVAERIALPDQTAQSAPSGECQVLLPPLVAADLARALGVLLSAENVVQQLPALLKRINRPIASRAVTLIDDGRLPNGHKSAPLDDEGTPTTTTMLVEQGTLRSLLHTLQSAAQLGVPANGKATRTSLWLPPRTSPSNIYLQAGTTTPDDLRGQLRRGVLVESALRPGRLQGTTGNFTLLARGWWVEDGQAVRPVSSVPLSANIFDLLRSVQDCDTDLQFSVLADGAGAPGLLIERMMVG